MSTLLLPNSVYGVIAE